MRITVQRSGKQVVLMDVRRHTRKDTTQPATMQGFVVQVVRAQVQDEADLYVYAPTAEKARATALAFYNANRKKPGFVAREAAKFYAEIRHPVHVVRASGRLTKPE